MPQVTRLRVVGATIAAGALTLGTLVTATAAQAATPRRAIADSHPAWAVAAKRLSSQAVTAGTVNARVYLTPSHQAELASLVAAVSSPASKSYRHFMSPAAVRKEFAPSAAEVASVKSWLTSAGLSVTKVNATYPAGAYVGVRGSVAAASKAFGVTFGTYRGPGGQSARAPQQAATAPSSVASSVLAVSGLDTAKSQMKPALPPPGPNYWVAKPCSAYYGQKTATSKPKAYGKHQPWANCGYTPSQIRGAYGVTGSGMTGKGQTVAVVDAYASPTMLSDANQYATATGDQPFKPGQYKQYQAGRSPWPGRTSATRRLVRRGDPGRRVGARQGTRRQRPVRRRGQLQRLGPCQGAGADRQRHWPASSATPAASRPATRPSTPSST